ncbi:phosphomannomutase [Bdellovibrio sp. ZAP7]|uniref:phosphomannomutase n=1 Tax=Bdellovibrio sp. ZAP7 TaxID=2231053 RepID=UPI00115B16E6|nr:phosphomannomutase [Bdellovibrio sp. ZAP7]QDK45356.1 phosphomannomutase [Bdellovibrio sp. ZAP7]
MALKFGTSGVRGLVTEFTDREAYLLTCAFLKHADIVSPSQTVAVGMDLRESSPKITAAVQKALQDHNKTVQFCGVLPTPALAYFSAEKGSMAVMITGSHIPADRNGIKFYLTSGETLKSDDEKIFNNYESLQKENYKKELFNDKGEFLQSSNSKSTDCSKEANDLFVQRYVNAFSDISFNGMKVIFYEHSSAARGIFGAILEKLGAQVIRLGYSDKFIPVDTEAVESLDLFSKWIKEHNADILVSTDGDGDRPLVIDNQGRLVQGDKLGIICSEFLAIEAVALPISCNSGISGISSFKKINFTKIGSPYVVEALNNLMTEFKSVAGFEANGGFILATPVKRASVLKPLPTRDSVLPALTIIASAKKHNCSVAEVVDQLPNRFTSSVLAKNCPLEKSQKILQAAGAAPEVFVKQIIPDAKIQSINTQDGLRMTTDKNKVIHLRPSGNAPEFRCYTESDSQKDADLLSAAALHKILAMIQG